MIKALGFLFYCEFILRLRRSQEWLYPMGFFFMVMCFFPLAFSADPILLKKILPGCIWMVALLASLLAVENIFANDIEDGHLEQLLLSDFPLPIILLVKLTAQWMLSELPLILLTPVLGLLLQLPAACIGYLCLTLLLGTPLLTLIGSLAVSLTLGLRQQGVLLSLMVLPLATPVLIFGVNIVQEAQAGFSVSGACAFMAGISLLAIILLPLVIAAALRIGLDD